MRPTTKSTKGTQEIAEVVSLEDRTSIPTIARLFSFVSVVFFVVERIFVGEDR
jgi:hypothetical protein